MKRLPLPTVLMGIVSPLPAIVLAVGGLFSTADVPGTTMGLVEYAALLLAFSGAVHWGLALDRPTLITGKRLDTRRDDRRLMIGGLPLPVGWVACHATFLGHVTLGLAALMAGFFGLFLAERAAWRRGELPSGYLALRLWVTAIFMACLGLAMLIRLA
ncbi:DUF3429 domain-containing protein [Gluconacetobacter sacchari]|uniref:DUF3429 domain-containing protein n=2 Tax=Gluconacetobacter sacchari TaxID=92759 RepID=A0A7W4NPH5_9PROT|nr:DUF3429 domain-containing protein [Gluconacetobacter sacchari]MBB2159118.1 DUF3429 domain-containing protein [Gluconacetobacter sacchari]GBQ31786.1 hypothetical protein AA12717_3876 [Gluconacetobacter sacchari DSM 12717]